MGIAEISGTGKKIFYIGPMIIVKVHLHCRFLAFKMPATAALLALASWLVWLPIVVFPLAKFIGKTVSGIALRLHHPNLPCCTSPWLLGWCGYQ